ncbi:MAG TPA: hypothetical protein VLB79_13470 [Solirubrobacterales bacterium]|nr:hypothetical protein [Solirubrobacterales bacterium]
MSPSRPKSRAESKSRTGSSAGARSANRNLAPADELKREIQAVLTDELRSEEHRLGHGRYDGFAYPAAEAYFHLAGGHDANLHSMQLKHRGRSHWWLVDSKGAIIDLTVAPREFSEFPYDRGRRRPFRHTPAGLSRRARTIVERVRTARG